MIVSNALNGGNPLFAGQQSRMNWWVRKPDKDADPNYYRKASKKYEKNFIGREIGLCVERYALQGSID